MSWPIVKLGEVCALVTKGTTPTTLGYEFTESGIPFLRIQNIIEGTVSLEDVLFIDESTHRALGRSKIKGGDFLISIAGTIGRSAIVPLDFPESNCNQAVAILRFDTDKLWPRFLLHWLSSNEAIGQIAGKKVTATISNLSLGQIKDLEIPLPPLAEQKRIAAILDKADAIRRKRQQSIQLADDFLRAVFLDMFGDPATNPKGWEVMPLSVGIKSISAGWSASGENRPCSGDEKGVLKISAVTTGFFKPEENKFVSQEQIPDGKKLLFPKRGDLLFSRANTRELVAASCIVMEDMQNVFLPDKLWLIETDKNKLLPEFLNFMIWQPLFKEKLTSQATGTSGSMLNISKSKFEQTSAIFPDLEVQNKFKKIYWSIQESLVSSVFARVMSVDLFESLSQKAFRGEL